MKSFSWFMLGLGLSTFGNYISKQLNYFLFEMLFLLLFILSAILLLEIIQFNDVF